MGSSCVVIFLLLYWLCLALGTFLDVSIVLLSVHFLLCWRAFLFIMLLWLSFLLEGSWDYHPLPLLLPPVFGSIAINVGYSCVMTLLTPWPLLCWTGDHRQLFSESIRGFPRSTIQSWFPVYHTHCPGGANSGSPDRVDNHSVEDRGFPSQWKKSILCKHSGIVKSCTDSCNETTRWRIAIF